MWWAKPGIARYMPEKRSCVAWISGFCLAASQLQWPYSSWSKIEVVALSLDIVCQSSAFLNYTNMPTCIQVTRCKSKRMCSWSSISVTTELWAQYRMLSGLFLCRWPYFILLLHISTSIMNISQRHRPAIQQPRRLQKLITRLVAKSAPFHTYCIAKALACPNSTPGSKAYVQALVGYITLPLLLFCLCCCPDCSFSQKGIQCWCTVLHNIAQYTDALVSTKLPRWIGCTAPPMSSLIQYVALAFRTLSGRSRYLFLAVCPAKRASRSNA